MPVRWPRRGAIGAERPSWRGLAIFITGAQLMGKWGQDSAGLSPSGDTRRKGSTKPECTQVYCGLNPHSWCNSRLCDRSSVAVLSMIVKRGDREPFVWSGSRTSQRRMRHGHPVSSRSTSRICMRTLQRRGQKLRQFCRVPSRGIISRLYASRNAKIAKRSPTKISRATPSA